MALTLGCWIVHEVACKAVNELWTNSICCPELLRKQYVNPLCMTVGWQPTMVKYCMMHTLHLGICHWVNGGALLTLIHHNFFGSSTAPKKSIQSTSKLITVFTYWHPRHPINGRDHAPVESPIPGLVQAAWDKPWANLHWYSTLASRGLGWASTQSLW